MLVKNFNFKERLTLCNSQKTFSFKFELLIREQILWYIWDHDP
jgi:hypothetical protein